MDVLGPQPSWLRSGHWEKPTSLRSNWIHEIEPDG
jgi:hypothetical protein